MPQMLRNAPGDMCVFGFQPVVLMSFANKQIYM